MGARGPKPRDPAARFAEKVRHDPVTGCWLWTGHISPTGYGWFYVDPGRSTTAHRWAYLRWNDVVPDDFELDHLCRNRSCANPWHLEAVTSSENSLRGINGRLSGTQTPLAIRERNRAKTARYRARKKAAA